MARILIVDDRAINRECLATLLGYGGNEVVEAGSAAEALELARSAPPGLVITDILMPGMSGFELVDRLKADPRLVAVPVIFYTAAYRQEEVSGLPTRYDNARVLAKPSEPEAILAAVARALAGMRDEPAPLPPAPSRTGVAGSQALGLRLAALLELSLSLAGEGDVRKLLQLACRGARDILGMPHVAVGLVDESGRLQHLETTGFSPEAHLAIGTVQPTPGFLSGLHLPADTCITQAIRSPNRSYGWLYLAGQAGWSAPVAEMEQVAANLAAQLALTWENLRSRQMIAERERRLSAMVAAAMDAIVTLDEDQRIQLFNPAAEAMFGRSREEMLGQPVDCLIPERYRENHRWLVAQIAASEGQGIARRAMAGFSGLRADGSEFPIEASLSVVEEGGRRFATVILRDVTRRKRSEERLRRLAEVVEGMAAVYDRESLIAILKSAARELSGADGVTIVLREGDQCHHVDEDAIAPLWKGRRFPMEACISEWAMNHAQALAVEDVLLDPRIPADACRSTFVRGLAVVPIGGGKPVGAIGCCWADVRRTTDSELNLLQTLADTAAAALANLDLIGRLEEARLEAERANEAKTRFLAAASHDLRQPLHGLQLFLSILERKLEDKEEARRICSRMGEALKGTEKMLGRLLEFAALESGQVAVQREVFSLDKLVRRIAVEHLAEAVAKGLALRIRTFPCAVDSDPVLAERIIRNFLVNAIRYTTRGGILIGLRRRGGLLRVEVHDTGPGIPEGKHELIFEEFRQLDNPARELAKGVGLGLAIVARTARRLGHPLLLRSREGKGSMFAVSLPEVAAPPEAPALIAAAPVARRPATVLVVEDDPVQAMAMEMLLRDAGYEVRVAHHAREALAVVNKAPRLPPALIVTDYRLPGGVNGIELVEALRVMTGRAIPAILATGDTQAHIADAAVAAGCRVVHKPCDAVELLALIAANLATVDA